MSRIAAVAARPSAARPSAARPFARARTLALATALATALVGAACSPEIQAGGGNDAAITGATDDGGAGAADLAALGGGDGAVAPSCDNPLDHQGCGCTVEGSTRACYRGPAATQHRGLCHDGTQTCQRVGEFASWGPCTGDTLPAAEQCGDGQDHDCNGLVGCDDLACGGKAGCCTPGATRPCYDGPAGTSGKGVCHAGTQTCGKSGAWPMDCPGETLPGTELGHCHDGLDNDCNGKTDCQDLLCLIDPACAPKVCTPGDTQACYDGPSGSDGKGACKAGTKTCAPDGKSYGACQGQVLPGNEAAHCADGLDNDCNGLVDCKDPACSTAPSCCMPSGPVDTTLYAHSVDKLYKVDPTTFAVTLVGSFGVGDSMTDFAVTPDGHLYAISYTALYGVSKVTGQATHVSDLSGTGNNSMTFLPDGTLLVADSSGAVKRVNPANGAIQSVGGFGNGLTSAGDLVAVSDGTMYGVSATTAGGGDASGNNVLLRVDGKSGKATVVGPTGFGNLWGLAYAKGRLIGFTNGGQIVEIDPATGKGTLIASKGIGFYGAGMSPLVSANLCP